MKARRTNNPLSLTKNKYLSSFTDFMEASNLVASCAAPNNVTLRFTKAQSAQLAFNFLVERLPLLKTEFPKIDGGEVTLSSEQFLYCERQAMCESGQLNTDYLADCLLKTLRADEFDFSYQFILGIIPGENNSRRLHNLRPFQRKPFLIAPDGTIQAREDKQPMYSREEKIGLSQAQSNTLLDPAAISRAFGFSRYGRSGKLYGIVTHCGDALLNRLLTDDSGTVSRIFDFDTAALAENGLSYLEGCLYTTDQLEEFKAAKNKFRLSNSMTNEVLARIRFNPYRSVVCICSDALEARLLAYDFARELLEHYKIYAEQHGLRVNSNFKIPIIYYIKKNIFYGFFSGVYHDVRQYTNQMRKQDEAEAISIYADLDERKKHYRNNDFEFLLGLSEITHEILLDTCLGEPLAYVMLKNGYARMLMRLLTKPNLRDRVFSTLTDRYLGLFKINDPIIASLVLAEQFDLADKLINATVSHKHQIQIECTEFHNNLLTYILYRGNPRQIKYIGLDDILLLAADRHLWVTVRLCLKEFSDISSSTLKSLYSTALRFQKTCELKSILQSCAEVDAMIIELFNAAIDQKNWEFVVWLTSNPVISGNMPLLESALNAALKNRQIKTTRMLIEQGALTEKLDEKLVELFNIAISHEHWECVVSLSSIPFVFGNKPLLGRALIVAIKCKNVAIARLLINKGALPEKLWFHTRFIEGTLYYALNNRLFELIPDVIEVESKYSDDAVQIRCLVALHLANELQNHLSIECLESIKNQFKIIDLKCIEIAILYLVLNALSDNNIELAEKRLITLCQQYQLLPTDNHSINDALDFVMQYFHDAATSSSLFDAGPIFSYLVKHYLAEKNYNKLVYLLTPQNCANNDSDIFYFCIQIHVYQNLFKYLSYQNVGIIKSFKHAYIDSESDSEIESDRNYQWCANLRQYFYATIQSEDYSEDKLLLLFDVGLVLSDDKWAWAFELLLKKGYLSAAAALLTHHQMTERYLRGCLGVLITYPLYIQALAPSLLNKIIPSDIRALSLRGHLTPKDPVITFIKLVKDSLIDNQACFLDLYPAFVFFPFTETLEIEKELMRLLRPATIRHMLLIFVVDRFRCHLKPFKDHVFKEDISNWPNLIKAFQQQSVLKAYILCEVKETLDPQQGEILSILNHYFSDIDVLPSEVVIETTFAKVQELFERANLSGTTTLSSDSDKQDINEKLLTYMKNIDHELSKSHQSSCQLEASLPFPDQNIDSYLDDSEVCYLY